MNEQKFSLSEDEIVPKGDSKEMSEEQKAQIKRDFITILGNASAGMGVEFNEDDLEKMSFTDVGLEILSRYLNKPDFKETIASRFHDNVKNFMVSAEQWKKAALKTPSLFSQSPETLNNNVERSSELMGLKKEQFVQAALKTPQLFSQSPETLNGNVERSSELMGLKKEQFVQAALKTPSLFYKSPETLNGNVERSSELMGLKKEQFVQAALKTPQLFSQSPETLNNNVERSSELMGLKKEQFVQAALKMPPLFSQSPETLNGNFRTLAILFGNDLAETRELVMKIPAILSCSQERDFIHFIAQEIIGKKQNLLKNPEQILRDYFEKQHPSQSPIEQFSPIYKYLSNKIESGEISPEKALKLVNNENLLGQMMLLNTLKHYSEESKTERKARKS